MYVEQARSETSAMPASSQVLAANQHYSAGNRPGIDGEVKRDCFAKAEKLLADVLRQSPEHSQALGLLGRIRLDSRSLEQARELFTKAVELSPEEPQLLCNLGYLALIEQRFGDAEGHFRSALRLDNRNASAFLGIAHVLAGQERFDQAYMHYRRMIELGYVWPSIFAGITHCCEHLAIDHYNTMIADDLLFLLGHEQITPQRLATVVADILEHKYAALPADIELLEVAKSDQLLLSACDRILLPSTEIESLLIYLRSKVFDTVCYSGTLSDDHQQLALALASYQVRSGCLFETSEQERLQLDIIHQQIARAATAGSIANGSMVDELAGACIVVSMFDILWRQPYSLLLAALDVADWPLQCQDLLQRSFYDFMTDENFKQQFSEKKAELLLAANDIPLPYPTWQSLPVQDEGLLVEALQRRFDVDLKTEHAMVAIIGSAADPQTLAFAKSFTDSTVLVVDFDLCDLAYGARKAKENGLENIVFWPLSMFSQYIKDGNRFDFMRIDQWSANDETNEILLGLFRDALRSDGVLNIRLNHAHAALNAFGADHSNGQAIWQSESPGHYALQQIRAGYLAAIAEGECAELARTPEFYSLHGFRKLLSARAVAEELPRLLGALANEVQWKTLEAQNVQGHSTHRRNSAQAWQRMTHLEWDAQNGSSWYFRKR
ncbi:tetratricopeptide repeat protein [Allohahella sp. A8]|uniref:tetratricopeptide repeat protein n=1 Tax=Allohahella sp. A8 TaxID=3141461 RepID=UPI003A80EA76